MIGFERKIEIRPDKIEFFVNSVRQRVRFRCGLTINGGFVKVDPYERAKVNNGLLRRGVCLDVLRIRYYRVVVRKK